MTVLDRTTTTRTWLPVALGMLAVAWGGNEFTPLLVMYREGHGFSPVVVDVFLFAYVVGIVPALLIGGPLSDRYGRRPLMVPAPAVAAAGSLVIALGAHSAPILATGRVLSGIALGLGMAVGGSWLKELSADGSGARRAAMSLTGGFATGAGVAGVLAQWAPWPEVLPYLVHVALAALATVALLGVPETRARAVDGASLLSDLRIPSAGHRRFVSVVLPMAPWVFGAASVAYAVLPGLMADHSGAFPIAFSALLGVVALSSGFAIQAVGRRIDTASSARAVLVALGIIVVGMVLVSVAADVLTIPMALLAAAVLGCGYGMAMVSGLQEVQRIAGPRDLAGLTAVFYSVTYLGFAVPAILALLVQEFPGAITYPELFTAGAVLAAISLALVATRTRSHLPSGQSG
ncbi:MFS transporter [Rhodococcus sp. BP-349]|uniref:MFS transporter n=1 Tax=unclassified Rhodococcus (in: high G+C Gram-positive bacteria) TaxID=192944 RepID=UPI001C9AFAF6|nr:MULTISPECIES: MFS transporter [unclassified Rhodococcus (in: high G+C Gram-positive bacteria)]MBY6537342.1 MFS transporter [Rhodococcus sp. BP-363]MBY6541679.1 MFS transporter [Rhodococcus sp. BP-369]MBY6560909.1 MFS transporter [Rhodococcus sp. BP-370]MBY6575201.1 MFS transporter [Rhodococcus sp. BP-364]MBY6584502.1 MFS transporter [Rhodococcus sp. BP-358]